VLKARATEIADAARERPNSCVRYGFCAPICPTYDLLRVENDGPRGRIALIKEMYAIGRAPKPATVEHLDRCLSCAACMSTCAAGVDYRRIIDDAKAYIEENFRRSFGQRLKRAIILNALTRPSVMRVLLFLSRFVPSSLIRWSPGLFEPFLALAKQLVPHSDFGAGLVPERSTEPHHRIFLLQGCVQQVVAPRQNSAIARLLSRNGCEVTPSRSAACCGALALHMGRPDIARRQAGAVLDELESVWGAGLDAVTSVASGCSAVIKEYGELFEGTPREAFAANVAALAREPSETLTQCVPNLEMKRVTKFSVSVHEPCSMQFIHKLKGAYQGVLERSGLVLLDVPEGNMCCGSAGHYAISQPVLSEKLGRRRAKQIEELNAPLVVSANIGCLMQLGRYLPRSPLHVIELVDWLNGGPQPPELEGWEQWPVSAEKTDNISSAALW
jgi:glycolate oxidase iron-sulfur subunit